jgi:Ig-like domain CHU_C associated/PKD domain/Secretion system C-terminal sorting domain
MISKTFLKPLHKALIWSSLMLQCALSNAQTTLISPTGDGGFESGTTFAANGWTVTNAIVDGWALGNVPAAVSAGSRAAYVSVDEGATWNYSQFSTILHLYKTVTVPAGETKLTLSFKWKVGGEGLTTSDWDNLKVFLVPTTANAPTQGVSQSTLNQLVGPQAISGMYKLSSTNFNAETISFNAPAGTYRLIFSWKSDGGSIALPPAAIDEIALVSSATPTISSTAMGGLWSSPSTWVGGVLPGGDDVVIAAGATVVMDMRVLGIRDLTIAGLLQCGTAANAINVRDVLIQNTGTWNPFTATVTPGATLVGQTINLGGNFTNNGTANLAATNTLLSLIGSQVNGRMTQTVDGTGTFIGRGSSGIIRALFCQTTGDVVLNTTQNIIVTSSFANTAGGFNSNGKLTIDNTAQVFGTAFCQQVSQIVVTAMGVGYTSAPTVTLSAPTGTGTTATAVANYDAVTGTVRSITITNPGSGYRISPTVTLTGGGFTTAATASATVHHLISGATAASTVKSGGVVITGGLNIVSNQSVGSVFVANTSTTNLGYTAAPEVGFSLPTNYLNLVTNGGSGYTSLPTITVSGGTKLTGGTDPVFTVIVSQGKVVSVNCTTGGTLWAAQPDLTITGGGGTGATVAFPTNCLTKATAVINNGMVSDFTVTNGGFGYSVVPTAGLVSAAGTFTTAAPTPICRFGVYNVTLGWYIPSVVLLPHQDDATIPANRRINSVSLNTTGGLLLNSNLELYSATPMTLTNGVIDLGNNTLTYSNPNYVGAAGSAAGNVNGNIVLNTWGGSATRTFPYDATLVVTTGTGSLATGSTVTKLTASRIPFPTGVGSPSGVATGVRSYKVLANAGTATYGTDPTVTLNFNAIDGVAADNATLFVGHAAANTGAWTVRSVAGAAGALATAGSRTTQITGVGTGPIVPTGTDYYGWVTTFDFNSSVATGNWNNPAIWSKGTVPVCTDPVFIQPTHTVTVNSAANVSKSLTVNQLGTLVVASGDLKVGCTAYNNSLSLKGILNVTGGALNVNGNIETILGSTFTQSGGDITVDGNDAGVAATSVAASVPLVKIVPANINSINLTGGTLTIVDPHASTTLTQAFLFNGNPVLNYNVTNGHTLRLGNGVSTDAGGSATNGFYLDAWFAAAGVTFGNMTLTGPAGTNRMVTSEYQLPIGGDLTINNGAELNTQTLFLNGNLNVNTGGTLTLTGALYLANAYYASGSAFGFNPSTNPQNISNTGIIRYPPTPSVNLGALVINNSHATGVTLNVPLSTNYLGLTLGKLNTTNTNLLNVGSDIFDGTVSGGSSTAFVNGPMTRTFSGRAPGFPYDSTALFPVGKGSTYIPVHLTPTTTTGGLRLKAEAFASNTGTLNAPFINLADKRWEVTATTNSNYMTAIGVRVTDAGITSAKEIVQSSSGTGVYAPIVVASTYATGTLTTATTIPSGSFTGFLSYGERCITPAAPTAAATQSQCLGKTVADLAVTVAPSATLVWYSAAAGGSPLAANTVLATGNYYVAQTLGGGCEGGRSAVAVTVNPLPTATITAGGATSICPDDVVSLSANTGTGFTYQWRRNAGAISGATNRTFSAVTAGAYSVGVTDANGCKATSAETTVTIFSRPSVSFTSSMQAGTGSILNFTNTSSAGTVRWYFGDALNSTTTTANPTFWYNANGTYSVRLVVTNANGCSDSTSTSIIVTGVRTGVNDLVEPLLIKVYPNPFAETVQIEIENANVTFSNNDKVLVTNALGQVVHQAVLNQKIMSLDTQNWSEGMYQVVIYTNGQRIPVQKVVKVAR